MLFPTVDFAVFFLVVFTGSWVLRPYKHAWLSFLVASSFVFYGWFSWGYNLLLAGSILGNWAFGRAIARAMGPGGAATEQSRWLVRVAVVANLALLGYFKYVDFFFESVVSGLNQLGLDLDPPLLRVLLPIGISFFTFQAISYVVDIGRGNAPPLSLLRFATYLSLFPQLVAGPIVRATELAPQFDERADPRYVEAARGFMLIFRGLFKKVVIASFLAEQIVDPVFANPSLHSQGEVLFAIYGFAIQIYADFSGYTDIAIGVALLLGFRLPKNFDAPYIATSMQEFWRRWHMTLSRWLRDYLYIPLGGNRISPSRTYANLMLTMLLGGLWHGAAWTFLIWGGIHGGALAVERRVKIWWSARGTPLGVPAPVVKGLQWFLTFHIVCLAWVFFRAPSLSDAMEMLGRLLFGGPVPVGQMALLSGLVVAVVVLAVLSQLVPERWVDRVMVSFGRAAPAIQIVLLATGLVLIDALGPEGMQPFIYFQF